MVLYVLILLKDEVKILFSGCREMAWNLTFWPLGTSTGDSLLTCSHLEPPARASSTGRYVLRRDKEIKMVIHHLPTVHKMRDRTTSSTLTIINGDSIHIGKPPLPDSTLTFWSKAGLYTLSSESPLLLTFQERKPLGHVAQEISLFW